MDAAYRLGITVVLASIVVAGGLSPRLARVAPSPPRAGQDLGGSAFELGPFRLVERSGRTVTDADLGGRVWVASFIFTRCPLSCPRISSVMKGLQGRLDGTGVRLVSISVDPEHDTPEVLAEYARRFGAQGDRWWFLTGPPARVRDLVVGRFKLGLQANGADEQKAGAEAITHSDRLALVDRGNRVVGYFDSTEPAAIADLIARAKQRDGRGQAPEWARRLPRVNASLNGCCAVVLVLGWTLIRRRRARAHAWCMIAAVVLSALFLGCYLVYHYHVGSVPFPGRGPVRLVYFTILVSHTLLATFGVVPLVGFTLNHAVRGRFARHARLARVTFPIWLYVSITGVVIYVMLYQLPAPAGPLSR